MPGNRARLRAPQSPARWRRAQFFLLPLSSWFSPFESTLSPLNKLEAPAEIPFNHGHTPFFGVKIGPQNPPPRKKHVLFSVLKWVLRAISRRAYFVDAR